jgi:hypothetical protein
VSDDAHRGNGILFVPTDEERTLVERLTGLMVSVESIAQDWIKPPISKATLRKHFRTELTRGRERTFARLKAMIMRAAEGGSVPAQKYLLERFFFDMMPPLPASLSAADVLGAPAGATIVIKGGLPSVNGNGADHPAFEE